jgi:ubiquitin carboxyl-terminal hydrolase L5
VIFLFKYTNDSTKSDQPKDGTYDYDATNNIFFANQTIQNACGTQALLSVLLNKDQEVDIGTQLRDFKDFTGAFPPDLRGEALSNSELIRNVHNSFARSAPFVDETARIATEEDDLFHFVAYSSINGCLYELDGLQPAPISHGPCSVEEFPEKVIPVLQRRIQRYPAHEIRFNLMAMVQDPRIRANEIGDQETVEREGKKREAWMWENALRRHNFVGFIDEVLKAVVRGKIREGNGAYERWVQEGIAATKKRVDERQKKGGSGDVMEI